MRLLEWFCFFIEKLEHSHAPDYEDAYEHAYEHVPDPEIGYFFFDEDTGEIHSI